MHDLDRTLRAYDSESDAEWETGEFGEETEYDEIDQEYALELDHEFGAISEEEENELAEELLTLSSEAELDQFLGKFLRKTAGRFVKALKPLGQILKPLAKKLLPIAGTAAGAFFGGPVGAKIGGHLGSFATKLFELESDFEYLPPQEQQMEIARRFLRFAASAAQNAAAADGADRETDANEPASEPMDEPGSEPSPDSEPQDPVTVARGAIATAADVHAPGLVQPLAQLPARRRPARGNGGRWYRRGNTIVVRGA